MKSALFIILFLICFSSHAQVVRDSVSIDTATINSIRNNLDKYNKVRQRAFTFAVTSGLCGAVAIVTSQNNSDVSLIMADISAVMGLVSFFTFNHADKYMRKISLEISPGKLRINF